MDVRRFLEEIRRKDCVVKMARMQSDLAPVWWGRLNIRQIDRVNIIMAHFRDELVKLLSRYGYHVVCFLIFTATNRGIIAFDIGFEGVAAQ